MRKQSVEERMALILIVLLLVTYAGLGGAHIVGNVVCQDFTGAWNAFSWWQFVVTADASILGEGSNECFAPAGVVYGIFGVFVLLCGVTVLVAISRWNTYRATNEYFRAQVLGRKEIAGRSEIVREMGEKTAMKRGLQIRPTLRVKSPDEVAVYLGTSRGVGVYLSCEDACLILGPPRSGKGFGLLVSMIMEAVGPVVTTSSRGDNMEATIESRATKGPVFLFDPEGVTGRTTTIRWSPVRGCERPDVAKKRAMTLVSGTGLGEGANKEWAGKAADVLQCLLHAAAVGGVSLQELHEWTKSPASAARAVTILEDKSTLGWAPMLEAVLNTDARSRGNQWFGVQSSLSAFDVPAVREVFEIHPGDVAFDPEAFLRECGTLYMVSELRSTQGVPGGAGVFFSMLLDDIVAAAHRVAMTSLNGRLDPPVTLILDEIANIHPWAGLPQIMAAGSGEGIQAIPVFQSRSQIRDGWGEHGERTIWESATRKVLLGGSSDASDLRNLMDLMGNREETYLSTSFEGIQAKSHSEQVREKPVLSADELRRLPEKTALLVAGRARPIFLDLIPWPDRPWAKDVQSSKAWHKKNPAIPNSDVRAQTFSGKK